MNRPEPVSAKFWRGIKVALMLEASAAFVLWLLYRAYWGM